MNSPGKTVSNKKKTPADWLPSEHAAIVAACQLGEGVATVTTTPTPATDCQRRMRSLIKRLETFPLHPTAQAIRAAKKTLRVEVIQTGGSEWTVKVLARESTKGIWANLGL